MRMVFDKDREIYRREGAPGAPDFTDIQAGFGFMDSGESDELGQHWAAVVGKTFSSTYVVLGEASGDSASIARLLCALKDQFLFRVCWHDARDEGVIGTLLRYDGLCHYSIKGKNNVTGRTVWEHPPAYWPEFRDYNHHVASVAEIHHSLASIQSGIDLALDLIRNDRLIVRPACPRTAYIVRQPNSVKITHPLTQAIVWPLIMLERSGSQAVTPAEEASPAVFPNFRR